MSSASIPDFSSLTLEDVKKLSPEQRKLILAAVAPRMNDEFIPHVPHPPQQVFLNYMGKEGFYGGAVAGGKSDALLMSALQFVDVPGYAALILRRTWGDLMLPGAIMDRASEWLRPTSAYPRDGGRVWRFPSGARLQFGYVQYDRDKYQYASAEFQYIGIDELTQWNETTYEFLFSRLRRPSLPCAVCGKPLKADSSSSTGFAHRSNKAECTEPIASTSTLAQYTPSKKDGLRLFDVPLRMRSASNPGGIGHEWVKERFIDPLTRRRGTVFVPARIVDNPSLDEESYREALSHLGEAERQRLEEGNWEVTEEGFMFQRHWVNYVEEAPRDAERCRFWDLAATDSSTADWTAGVLLALRDGQWWVEHVERFRGTPLEVERVIAQTAAHDRMNHGHIRVRMEQEPGSGGVNTISHYRNTVLAGYDFDGVRPTGSKEERARPMVSAAQAGNFHIVLGQWTQAFINELTAFPYGANDDQIDGLSGAFHELAFGSVFRILV
jgi:predicted phage terminase large subunit-like protein